MSRPESAAPDRPFPGAHSQVPGAHDEPAGARAQHLTLEASRVRSAQGWSVRVPVRAEQVHVSKQVVVRERVTVRRKAIGDVAHLEDEVRREVLDIDSANAVNDTRHNQDGLQAHSRGLTVDARRCLQPGQKHQLMDLPAAKPERLEHVPPLEQRQAMQLEGR